MKTQLTAAPAFNYVGVKAKPNTAEQATTNLNLNAKPAVEQEDTFELSAPQARSGVVPRWLLLPVSAVAAGLVSCAGEQAPKVAQTTAPEVAAKAVKCIQTIKGVPEEIVTLLATERAGETIHLGVVLPSTAKNLTAQARCDLAVDSSPDVTADTAAAVVTELRNLKDGPMIQGADAYNRSIDLSRSKVLLLTAAEIKERGLKDGINNVGERTILVVSRKETPTLSPPSASRFSPQKTN